MKILQDYRAFVKGQMDFHQRRARNPHFDEDRRKQHENTAENFKGLLEAIEKAPQVVPMSADPLTLAPDDLTGLPPELLKELNVSESDKTDALILEAINAAGGTLLLDKILIALYKKTGEVYGRQQVISRIYRMGKKHLVRSIPGKKGVYTTLREGVYTALREDFGTVTFNPNAFDLKLNP